MPSSNPSPSPAGNKAPAAPITHLLTTAPSTIDAFLARLHRIAATRSGADVVLLFLTYATGLSANLLEAGSRAALRNSANKLVAVALQLPPAAAVTFASSAPIASPVVGIALKVAARLKAASATLSEVRTFGRLWGLLGLYFAAKKFVLSRVAAAKDPEKKTAGDSAESHFDTVVAALQLLSLISFQAAENVAYLSSKKILGFSPATQGKLARWSVRSWAAYIGMELGRLLVERQRRVAAAAGGRLTAKDAEWSAAWKRDFFRNLAWSPITVHWSVDNGPLSDLAVSLLAFYPAVSQMRELWRANA